MTVPSVLVVGAGPAGATAARTLALGGARVQLLERYRLPRNKPCGGGITMRVMRRFPYLASALDRISTHYVSRLHLEGPSGASAVLTSPTPAVLLIRRVEFDHLLSQLAVEAGAELVENAWVSQVSGDDDGVRVETRDGRTFSADALIAADGVNGVVTRRIGLHGGWDGASVALDMMEETPNERLRTVEPGTLWVSYGHGGTDGYGYIFPKRDHVNVGIGCLLSYFRAHVDRSPYEIQQQFVADLRRRGILCGVSRREDFTPYHIPVCGPVAETGRGRVLVAGDAGGFVNAYTAEGIYYAMVSGDLAARAALEVDMVDDPGGPRNLAPWYRLAWRREIGAELRDSVLIQRYLFRQAARIEAVIRGAAAYRDVADTIIGYVAGTVTYAQARRRLLAQFPHVAFRLAGIALFS
ncbi:MAG TPA: NAD(P)/FAD-dependent oxidoreductase [Vicinamibacterales bacterium]